MLGLNEAVNELTQSEFFARVGAHGHREVVRLANWLLTEEGDGPRDLELHCRYAPSIVTRSEVDVFGLSEPRFAVRLNLDGPAGVNVVNLRQIERLRAANPRWGRQMPWLNTRASEPLEAMPTPRVRPGELLRQASRIADCLLQPPKRIGGDWTVLRADLGREYGEASKPGELLGTPYVKHIPLVGGGLCAQAVCFMATALLHEHASGIHGLLEVTALAQREEIAESELGGFDVYEMQISGLNYSGIARYFREVGLRSIKQLPKTLGYADPAAAWTNRNDCFTAAARAYLRSGMPIVLTVDAGRLAAPAYRGDQLKGGLERPVNSPIYDRNGYTHPGFETIGKGQFRQRRDHAVLLVGCKNRDGSEAFLVNDPAALPFLQASTGELADAGYYFSKWSKDGKIRVDDFQNLRSLQSLPVTPAAVKLPLLWWLPETEADDEDTPRGKVEHWRDGLFAIVPILQSGAVSFGRKRLPFVAPKERFRRFHLVQLKGLVPLCADFLQGEANLPDIAAIREQLLERFGWGEGHWAWVQFVREPRSIWIYDAEREFPADDAERDTDARQGFLRIGVWREADDWNEVVAPKKVARADRNGRPAPLPSLKRQRPNRCQPAAMTSCSAAGLRKSLEALGGEVEHVELYAFMNGDVAEANDSALEFMAANEGDPQAIAAAARQLVDLAWDHRVSISAIATYLPELADLQRNKSSLAVRALGFLVELSEALRGQQLLAHDPKTIEIVAGSRIQGVWPGKLIDKSRASGPVYVANVMSRAYLGQTLLGNLRTVVEQIDVASPVRFAFELEPGPLHLLNDWDALVWFALRLERDEVLGARVGFNLDIAHWAFLAGIRADQLAPTTELGALVRRRILHAHIADHRLGHFGDQAPGALNDERAFAPWLELLDQIAAEERPAGMDFSGFVSLELEACREAGEVTAALRTLRRMLGNS